MGNSTDAPTTAPNPFQPHWELELQMLVPSNSRRCGNFSWRFEYPTMVSNKWDYIYHLMAHSNISVERHNLPPPRAWDMCFCARGSVFIWFLVLSLAILLIASFMVYYVFTNNVSQATVHRRVLFVSLLGASIVRAIYSSISLHKIIQANTIDDVLQATRYFVLTLIPVMAISDYFGGLVDFAMAIFWYTVNTPGRRYPIHWFVLSSIATLKVLMMLVSADALAVSRDIDADPRYFYNATLWYISIMVFAGAVSHVVVGSKVIRTTLSTSSDVVFWTRFKAMWPLFTIVFVTATTGFLRALILFGRQLDVDLFVSGSLSLNNPSFTEFYFIAIMQLPPLVVALIAATMTAKSTKELRDQEQIANQLVLDGGSGYGTVSGQGNESEARDDPDT